MWTAPIEEEEEVRDRKLVAGREEGNGELGVGAAGNPRGSETVREGSRFGVGSRIRLLLVQSLAVRRPCWFLARKRERDHREQ